MCGIAGYITKERFSDEVLKRMTDRIAHRGPDAEGFYFSKETGSTSDSTEEERSNADSVTAKNRISDSSPMEQTTACRIRTGDILSCQAAAANEKIGNHPYCALGHRRLSIIDLEGGDQPIYNEDRDLIIVFNGEIYNFQKLRKELEASGHSFRTNTDTEVIIHGYEEWGTSVTDRLRGMFAFAIWDEKNARLFMARDKWGIKPLYYYVSDGAFLFASEIKAFLDHPCFKKELNENILAAYLCFNSTPTEETFFKGVFRLEPGHRLIYDPGKNMASGCGRTPAFSDENINIRIEKYFELDLIESASPGKTPAGSQSLEKYSEMIAAAMEDSVRHHRIADVEVGSFLSSGIDSSYITALLRPDKTFTVGYSDERYDEIRYAKDLAEKLGIRNFSKEIDRDQYLKAFPDIIYHMDEPLADPAAIALYFVARTAAKEVKVVTSGEGADELFGGYLTYMEEADSSAYMKLPFSIRRGLSKIAGRLPEFPGRNYVYRRGRKLEEYHIGLGRVFSDEEALSIVKNKNQISTGQITAPYYARMSGKSNLAKRQTIDFYFWLVRDFLHAVDRNTMMFGLEARTPFLDDSVYDVARKLPVEAKIGSMFLPCAAPKTATSPLAPGVASQKTEPTTKPALRMAASRVIPNNAYKKKKLGFPVPLREWMKMDDLYSEIKTRFNSETGRKFFETEKINRLLEDQKTGRKDSYKKVWAIYTFIVWYDIYFSTI